MGYKNRFAYLAFADPEAAKLEVNQDDLFLQGFIKYDLIEELVVAKVHFGATKSAGEVFYQQRDNTDPLNDEDNGYLMTAVFDAQTKTSEFVMWDSKDLANSEPVCLESHP